MGMTTFVPKMIKVFMGLARGFASTFVSVFSFVCLTRTAQKQNTDEDSDFDDEMNTKTNIETCSICLSGIKTPFGAYCCTQCNRKHHAECQMQWFQYAKRTQGGVSCPLCRSNTVDIVLLERLVLASREQKEYEKHIQTKNIL